VFLHTVVKNKSIFLRDFNARSLLVCSQALIIIIIVFHSSCIHIMQYYLLNLKQHPDFEENVPRCVSSTAVKSSSTLSGARSRREPRTQVSVLQQRPSSESVCSSFFASLSAGESLLFKCYLIRFLRVSYV